MLPANACDASDLLNNLYLQFAGIILYSDNRFLSIYINGIDFVCNEMEFVSSAMNSVANEMDFVNIDTKI